VHLPASCTVTISISATNETASLLLQDDGPGFTPDISSHIFERRVKRPNSKGRGLGLAFVKAVVRAPRGHNRGLK
jgi:signal transduction histidine kinase